MKRSTAFLAACFLSLFALPVFAAEVTLTMNITNQGQPMPKAWFAIYKPGKRNSYIKYAYSGKQLKFEPGTYDIGIHFEEDAVDIVKWEENVSLISEDEQRTFELGVPLTDVCFTISNGSEPSVKKAWWGLYKSKEENYLRYAYSSKCILAPSGVYTVGIHYEDDAIEEVRWLENEKLEGPEVKRTYDLALPVAEVKYTMTNNGQDVGRKAWWGLYAPGKHESYLRYKHSGESMSVKAGVYDIGVEYTDGNLKKKVWLNNEQLEGTVDRKIELNAATTHAKVTVTNNGADVGRKAWWAVYKPGKHNSYLAYKFSGETMTIDSGIYDVGIFFKDGDAQEERWLENQTFENQYEKSYELALPLAEVKVVVTNNGVDTARKSWWGLYDKGERGNYLAYKYSGDKMIFPEGVYDLGVHFKDGAVELTRWVPDFEAKGKIDKTVELSAGIVSLTVHVTHKGQALPAAWCGAYKSKQSPSYEAYARSDKVMRVLTGTYDIGCFSNDKGLDRDKWLERQELKADTTLSVEIDEVPASLIVRAGAAADPRGQKKGSSGSGQDTSVAMIFDASGSMAAMVEENKNRIEVAKEVLSGAIDTLPADVRVELSVYGISPKAKIDCRDTKVLFPLGPVQAKALKEAIEPLKPGGYTPIAYSLEKAAANLPRGGNNSLILVTDGIESCNGDPCAVAARLSAEGLVTRSFVVGFGLDADKGRFLSCIGKYYPAGDRAGLQAALKEVVAESLKPMTGHVTIYRPGERNEVVAQGSLDEKLVLPAGAYDVLVQIGAETYTRAVMKIEGDVEVALKEMQSGVGAKP